MRIFALFLVLLSLSINYGSAQKNTNTWYFGRNAGIDFNDTQSFTSSNFGVIDHVPKPLTGPVNTAEGCFTLSDKRTGALIMSSDGSTLYNKENKIMLNGTGLKGDPSSTSSGIVIPYPGNKNLYYAISVGATSAGGQTPGIHYSVVDMTLDGGLGGVTSQKNIPLSLGTSGYTQAYLGENVAAIKHKNGTDYWLLTRFRKVILVWAITAKGISEPVVYDNLFDIGAHFAQGLGYFKFNPNGDKFIHIDHANLYWSGSRLTIGDFDRSTGIITNIKDRSVSELANPYSLEFSPNGKYVYFTSIESFVYNGLIKTKMSDLENLEQTTIPNTRIMAYITCVQLGPDGRIYGIANNSRNLYAILDPDSGDEKVASLVNYLNPGTASVYGLPVFAVSLFKADPIMGNKIICSGRENSFSIKINLTGLGQLETLKWDFKDGTIINQTFPPGTGTGTYTLMHTFETKGKYAVSVTPVINDEDGISYEDPDKVSTSVFEVIDCSIITNKMIRQNITPY